MNRLNNYINLISKYGGEKTKEKLICEYLIAANNAPDSNNYLTGETGPPEIADWYGELQEKLGKFTEKDVDSKVKTEFIQKLPEWAKCSGGPAPKPPAPPPPRVDVPPPGRDNGENKITAEIPYYDSGDQQYHTFKVTVYATKQNRDLYVGGGSVSRAETVKSVLDSFKQKCNTCIVSSGKQYVKSLEGKDLYTTFAHLNLKYDNAEIYIIS
jgi:hypothetical protein